MFVLAVVAILCMAGVAFCMRVLAALLRDRTDHGIRYRVHHRFGFRNEVAESEAYKQSVTRAA
jgi:hypothetical protein